MDWVSRLRAHGGRRDLDAVGGVHLVEVEGLAGVLVVEAGEVVGLIGLDVSHGKVATTRRAPALPAERYAAAV